MGDSTKHRDNVRRVLQIFEENGFGNVELVEEWDGEDIQELSLYVTEEEFQTLLDQLEVAEEPSP